MTAVIKDFPLGLDPGVTRLSIDPDKVLSEAIGKCRQVLVIGWEDDGSFYFASSEASGPSVLWDLEFAKKRLLDAGGA